MRVRIATVTVQVVAYLDDGQDLTPLPVQPFSCTAAEFGDLSIERFSKELEAQLGEAPIPQGGAHGDVEHHD